MSREARPESIESDADDCRRTEERCEERCEEKWRRKGKGGKGRVGRGAGVAGTCRRSEGLPSFALCPGEFWWKMLAVKVSVCRRLCTRVTAACTLERTLRSVRFARCVAARMMGLGRVAWGERVPYGSLRDRVSGESPARESVSSASAEKRSYSEACRQQRCERRREQTRGNRIVNRGVNGGVNRRVVTVQRGLLGREGGELLGDGVHAAHARSACKCEQRCEHRWPDGGEGEEEARVT